MLIRVGRWVGVTSCLAALGCGLFTGPGQHADGTFTLVRYGELSIPAQVEALPDRDGGVTSCWYTLSQGHLGLIAEEGHFAYTLAFINSCTGQSLASSGTSGSFTQQGQRLTFRIVLAGLGKEYTFSGSIDGDTVRIRPDSEQLLVFVRDPP